MFDEIELQYIVGHHVSAEEAHRHSYHEIIYLTEGSMVFELDGKEVRVEPNMILIINIHSKHRVISTTLNSSRYILRFSNELLVSSVKDPALSSVFISNSGQIPYLFQTNEDMKTYLVFQFDMIRKELEAKEHFYLEECGLRILEILIRLHRTDENLFAISNDRNMRLVLSIQQELSSNTEHNYTLEELSDKYSLSKYYLSRLFSSVTGEGLKEYQMKNKIAKSKQLLVNTENPISSIAEEIGLYDSSYFTKVFKRQEGLTPKDFRNRFARRASTDED